MDKVKSLIPQGCGHCGDKAKDYCGMNDAPTGGNGGQHEEPKCEDIIQMLDESKDGKVSKAEAAKVFGNHPDFEEEFRSVDTDGSGDVTLSECKAAFEAHSQTNDDAPTGGTGGNDAPTGGNDDHCHKCAEDFDKAGGCAAMHEHNMDKVMSLIPQGCGHCGDKAKDYCGMTHDAPTGGNGGQHEEPKCEDIIQMLDESKDGKVSKAEAANVFGNHPDFEEEF